MGSTLEQKRAKHAWDSVAKALQLEETERKNFATESKKLPMRVMAAGLGSALAFIHAKAGGKKKGLGLLQDQLYDWVVKNRKIFKPGQKGLLVESIVDGNSDDLKRGTAETIAYLQWLNRIAEGQGLKPD